MVIIAPSSSNCDLSFLAWYVDEWEWCFSGQCLGDFVYQSTNVVSQVLPLSNQREICLWHQLKDELRQIQRNHCNLNSKLALPHVVFETMERAFYDEWLVHRQKRLHHEWKVPHPSLAHTNTADWLDERLLHNEEWFLDYGNKGSLTYNLVRKY